MDMDREQNVQHFLDLIKKSHRGKFKIYIGMIAGVGKSYRIGNYKFTDFVRIGLPLNIITFLISIFLIPLIWPF